jgi:hypothetical protein
MKKHSKFQVEYLILMSIFILSLLVSCDTPWGGKWEYEFINKTQFSISITLNEVYYANESSDASSQGSSFTLYSNSNQTIYVQSGSLDFQWHSNSAGIYIYTSVSGSKVTFEER